MIKFSQFLQDNEKKKNEADAKRQEEMKKIDMLKKQIDKKKEQYEILLNKKNRIDLKVKAMKKYETYLESVRDRNPDEYQELNDILSRYQTLKRSNLTLTAKMQSLERELDDLKNAVTKYEKDMKTEIMQLNNEIAQLTQNFEKIED
jgi:chromosome segregation ATPase